MGGPSGEDKAVCAVVMLKCPSAELLARSRDHGVWGLSESAGTALAAVLERGKSGKVALVFSVNMSGHFQGYALVSCGSPVVRRRLDIWGGLPGAREFVFAVEVAWVLAFDLPFADAKHLRSEATNKGVQTTKHGQEMSLENGCALLQVFRSAAAKHGASQAPTPRHPIKLGGGSSGPSQAASGSADDGEGAGGPALSLGSMSFEDYAGLFDKFRVVSQREGAAAFLDQLESLGWQEKEDLCKALGKNDFLDACRIVCSMNNIDFSSSRERHLEHLYDQMAP
uniref:YTH domain-containing protein n=1 Tax=Chloropicon laureae TaxID=464258 RepID=A0A7S2Z374_9CHLO